MFNQDFIGDLTSVYENHERNRNWKEYFMELLSESISVYKTLSMESSKSSTNKKYNRYTDVLSFDHSRVFLPDYNETDYINANYVSLEDNKFGRKYILTQGPLPHTVSHFWSMIWNECSTCIIMVTKDIEKDRIKCFRYYPTASEPSRCFNFPNFTLEVTLENSETNDFYMKSILRVTNSSTNETRRIHHYYYHTWPDFGVPNNPDAFLQFLWDIRCSGCLDDANKPPVIHCSAGIGRSGTFVVVDLALLYIQNNESNVEKEDLKCVVDLKKLIMDIRRCRIGLVQSADQLRFSYQAVIAGAQKILENPDEVSDIKFLDLTTSTVFSDHNDQLWQEHGSVVTQNYDEEEDSDFDESNSEDNSAIDKAAEAAKSRRGFPLSNGCYDGSFELNQRNRNHNPQINFGDSSSSGSADAGKFGEKCADIRQGRELNNDNSKNSNELDVPSKVSRLILKQNSAELQTPCTLRQNSAEQHGLTASPTNESLATTISHSSTRDLRQSRIARTRQNIEIIRSNMRELDLERNRWFNRFLNRLGLRRFFTTHTPSELIWRISLVVVPVSIFLSFFLYKYWNRSDTNNNNNNQR